MIAGACHCGAVRIAIPAPPKDVNDCGCSICRRLGALWAYYDPKDMTIEMDRPTDTYVWGDRMLAFHSCATCGCTTHWSDIVTEGGGDRWGVNIRLFDAVDLDAIPHRRTGGETSV